MNVILYSILIVFSAFGGARGPILPDGKLTPGDVFLDVTVEQLAKPGYAAKARDVPEPLRKKVFAEYHIEPSGHYEVDHLISLELGGSNDLKNLWPQSYETQPWNAHVKDRLENHLHALVIHGKVSLKQAQKEIATNWIKAYQKYFPDEPDKNLTEK